MNDNDQIQNTTQNQTLVDKIVAFKFGPSRIVLDTRISQETKDALAAIDRATRLCP